MLSFSGVCCGSFPWSVSAACGGGVDGSGSVSGGGMVVVLVVVGWTGRK